MTQEQREVDVVRYIEETKQREVQYTVMVPQTQQREQSYTVMRTEQRTREESYTVMVPQQMERFVEYTVLKRNRATRPIGAIIKRLLTVGEALKKQELLERVLAEVKADTAESRDFVSREIDWLTTAGPDGRRRLRPGIPSDAYKPRLPDVQWAEAAGNTMEAVEADVEAIEVPGDEPEIPDDA